MMFPLQIFEFQIFICRCDDGWSQSAQSIESRLTEKGNRPASAPASADGHRTQHFRKDLGEMTHEKRFWNRIYSRCATGTVRNGILYTVSNVPTVHLHPTDSPIVFAISHTCHTEQRWEQVEASPRRPIATLLWLQI